jgi:hypothetical protein
MRALKRSIVYVCILVYMGSLEGPRVRSLEGPRGVHTYRYT